jgi:ATP-dependent Lon protease
MHKKDAKKRKKLINQIRHNRVMPDGRVLTADGRETLLGNLAPVKHIPMLPWKRVLAFPTVEKTITVSTVGENAWLYRLFKETTEKAHDLIGFTPVRELDATGYEDFAVGTIGMAVQIKEVEETDADEAIIHIKGVCRYENTGFQPSTEDHFCISIKWFEDTRESDSIVRPQYERCLKIFERLSKAAGSRMKTFYNLSKTMKYDYTAAQYLSFMIMDGFFDWFTDEEKWDLLKLRSTSARLRRICERSEDYVPELERSFKEQKAEREKAEKEQAESEKSAA